MSIINLFKNNFIRIINKKSIVVVALVVIPVMIGLGILFSGKVGTHAQIALVSTKEQKVPESRGIHITIMRKKPPTSTLLLGKYDDIVIKKEGGTYKVITLKTEEHRKIIETFFKDGKLSASGNSKNTQRGVGTNILGFIMMIILMQGVAITTLYPEDRTLKTFRRILTSPVNERQYFLAQAVFTFLWIYVPTYLAVAVTKVIFGVKIGFSLNVLALLIGILSILSTTMALFISSLLEDEVSLVASGIYVVTSILAGCFYSFTDNNKLLDAICSVIPQKEFMSLTQGLENGNNIFKYKGELLYLSVLIVIFFLVGSLITKRKVKRGCV